MVIEKDDSIYSKQGLYGKLKRLSGILKVIGKVLIIWKELNFLNTEIDNLTMTESVEYIDKLIQRGRPSYVVTLM